MAKSKSKFVKLVAAVVLGLSVFTAASVSYTTVAAAKTTYKISNNQLVNAKSKKAVKGYVSYNSKLYKDGKLYTGTYHSVYYSAGVKYSGIKSGKLYKSGKLVTTYTLYNGRLYKKGGSLNTGLVLYSGKLYNGSVYNRGYAIYSGKLYNGFALFTGQYNGVSYTKGVAAADVKAPVIALPNNGQDAYTVALNDVFTAPTASAVDDRDKTVAVTSIIKDNAGQTVKDIDTTKAGSYIITYTAVDSAGNKAEKSISVTVEDSFEVIDIS